MHSELKPKPEQRQQAPANSETQRRANNTGLTDNLKSGMEALSGMSLNHVKVHYNSSKPKAVQAHAYAQGSDIHLASGQERHLPHELGHVVQQMQGRVQPTTTVGGMAVNDNPRLEQEADSMGAKALQMKSLRRNDDNIKSSNIGTEYSVAMQKYASEDRDLKVLQKVDVKSAEAVIQRQRKSEEELIQAAINAEDWGEFLINAGNGPYKDFELSRYWDNYGKGIYEGFAESGTSDHGYSMDDDPAEFDGSSAVVQQKRKPGVSGPKNYGAYTNMEFIKKAPNATIDFNNGRGNSSSKLNNKQGSWVNLKDMLENGKIKKQINHPTNNQVFNCPYAGQNFDTGNRAQHFAMADMLYYLNHGSKPNRTGQWTWHHLEAQYHMVLVNMLVHAKHGHNGGVHIW